MSAASRSALLVAEREIREQVRSRSFRIITVLLIVASVGAVILTAVLGGGDDERAERVAVAGGPPGLAAAVEAAGAGTGLTLRAEAARDAGAARRAVDGGGARAALVVEGTDGPATVIVRRDLPAPLRAAIGQGLAVSRLRAALGGAGVDPARVAALTGAPRLEVSVLSPDRSPPGRDVGIGVLVAVVLYVALLFSGTLVASGVAEEKTSRVSEVLLASVRPTELLTGKVAGIGLVSIVQLAVAAAPAMVTALAIGAVDLPDATATALAWALVWFVAGYALYAAAYGALGALVGRQQEVGQVTAPLAMLLLAGYLSAVYAASDAETGLATTLSLLPPLAPLVMPVRIAAGAAGPGQGLLALALTLAAAAGIIALGARVYRRGIVRTGARTPLREALRGAGRA